MHQRRGEGEALMQNETISECRLYVLQLNRMVWLDMKVKIVLSVELYFIEGRTVFFAKSEHIRRGALCCTYF